MAAGVLLLILGFSAETPRLQRIPETVLGSFLFLIPLGYLHIHTSTHYNISKSSDLKILDWTLLVFDLVMMPCFDLLDLPPMFWLGIILIPSLIVRAFIGWYVHR
jgi:hypothetical protein